MRNRFVVVAVATFFSSSVVLGQQTQVQPLPNYFQDAIVNCIKDRNKDFVEGIMGDFFRRKDDIAFLSQEALDVGIACEKAIKAKQAAVQPVKN